MKHCDGWTLIYQFFGCMLVVINVVCVLGICALSVGFSGKTGFTFKLVHGEQMSETVNNVQLNHYVIQVIMG